MNMKNVTDGDRSHFTQPRCSGSTTSASLHVRSASWISQTRALSLALLLSLVAFTTSVSAAPSSLVARGTVNARNDNNSNNGGGSISMSVWLPILLVTVVFILFSLCACLRRCAASANPTGTTANGANSVTVNGNTTTQTRPRRRGRTPSQISTRSLPAYMKEPGDQELVLFRGPLETDDQGMPRGMPVLAESDEDAEMHDATFDLPLDRIESGETMPLSSTTNLIHGAPVSLERPPELHHATTPQNHRRSGDGGSLDSVGSEAELLALHQRVISMDDPRGDAPAYTEAVAEMTTVSLNDPQPNQESSNAVVAPSSDALPAAGRSRFSFLSQNLFHLRNGGAPSNDTLPRSDSPSQMQNRTGSALSRISSRESHESHHSRTPTTNLSRPHTRSSSNLQCAARSNSPVRVGSSTISAPLTHTLTHAGFHAPKSGLTPEQIKLITSREALDRFRMPYGPDAVAAFQLSRERLAEMRPPPDFETATTGERRRPGTAGSVGSSVEAEAVVGTTTDRSVGRVDPGVSSFGAGPSGSASLSSHLSPSQGHSRVSSAGSHATARNMDETDGTPENTQTVQAYVPGDATDADEPQTAQLMTPRTARPLSIS